MTIIDDWARFLQEQAANVEKWARENQLATGFIIVSLATVSTFAASKAYDAWLKG